MSGRYEIAYRDLVTLAVAIERDLARTTVPSPSEEARYPRHCLTVTPGPPSRSSHDERDILRQLARTIYTTLKNEPLLT